MPPATQTFIPFDLSGGALGIDRKRHRTFLIKPCGKDGVYVKFCHVIVLHVPPDEDNEGSSVRTRRAIMESEIHAWLNDTIGVVTDSIEWHQLAEDPKPDTYFLDELLAESEAAAKKKAENQEKYARAKERKKARARFYI